MKIFNIVFKNLDLLNLKIIKYGLIFSFIIAIIATIILIKYISNNNIIFLYNLGIMLFNISCYISVEFIICGFVVNSICNYNK